MDGKAPLVRPMRVPPAENYPTTDTTDDALSLVRSLPEPFLLYVSYNAAHAPVHALPPLVEASFGSGFSNNLRDMVRDLDRHIGRLLAGIDAQTTTVVLVGDNGTESRGLLPPFTAENGKGTLYESGCRVPMIVRSPLVPSHLRGRACDALVEMNDLFATFVEFAGGTLSPSVQADSRSLAPLLRGQTPTVRDHAYTELFHPNFDPTQEPRVLRHSQALRDERYKLLRVTTREHDSLRVEEEFFDLECRGVDTDWFEQRNLLAAPPLAPDAANSLARLRARLDAGFPALVR